MPVDSIQNPKSKIQNGDGEPELLRSAPWWRPEGFDENKLTSEERRVYGVVRFHLGAARAIKQKEIAQMTDLDDRQVQNILKHLTETHGLAIGALVKPPYGVYLIDTADELLGYCGQLHRRALSQLRREAILKRQHLLELLGQIRVKIEAEGR